MISPWSDVSCKNIGNILGKRANLYDLLVPANAVTTLVSRINVPGRLLIFKKIPTQDMLFPATPFIYFWNFFHPLRLFRTPFFLFRNIKLWRNKKLLFNYSYKNLLFRVLINLLFFDYPNHQLRNFTTSFFISKQ